MLTKRAVASAKKHGIGLKPGLENSADGNCAFESVILNINERSSFSMTLPFSADYYRRIWMTDFKNRTIDDTTWNIYTRGEWEEGWNKMMQSGIYEQGLFGDLMLFGIACGVRKVLLIFNTNLNTAHDPIYVCDPRKFGVEPDTSVPVVLAYDMSHYESLCPLTTLDVQKTSELVDEYLEGKYRFNKQDLPLLLSIDTVGYDANEDEENNKGNRPIGANKFQEGLPDHLRGKRPKDMTHEEKKEYNNFRRKASRRNESQEHSANRKQKEAEDKAGSRANETKSEKKKRNETDANNKASQRAKETDTDKKKRSANDAKHKASQRAKETETEEKQRK